MAQQQGSRAPSLSFVQTAASADGGNEGDEGEVLGGGHHHRFRLGAQHRRLRVGTACGCVRDSINRSQFDAHPVMSPLDQQKYIRKYLVLQFIVTFAMCTRSGHCTHVPAIKFNLKGFSPTNPKVTL